MKTRKPLILTAGIAEQDLAPFGRLRAAHFPPDRNHLRAHLTMFHRLPGEYTAKILDELSVASMETTVFGAEVKGLRHLGAGVAFAIESPTLSALRARLAARFRSWLGPQDLQPWRPHITVQNKVPRLKADAVFEKLSEGFEPHVIEIRGLDLWEYLGGPWQHVSHAPFVVGMSGTS